MSAVIVTDGLGNQMFQYALYLAMRAKGRRPLLSTSIISRCIMHNGFELCRDFGIDHATLAVIDGGRMMGRMTRRITRQMKWLCYLEDETAFSEAVFTTRKPLVYGFWQNIRYFQDIEHEVRKTFTFRGIDESNMQLAREISACNSVSIHIRRGDYLNYPEYAVCTPDYYQRAIALIKERVDTPMFYLFSDDLEWSDTFLGSLDIPYKVMRHNRGADDYKDMFLMTQCRHNILANSSFSWWGAWLGEQAERQVVCPATWNLKSVKIHPQLDQWVKI